MPARVPRLYLDTNVLLDLFFDRRPVSRDLVVLGISNGWDITSSNFALMELLDVVQENRWAVRRLTEEREQLNTLISRRHQRDLPEEALEAVRREINRFKDRDYEQITYYDIVGNGLLERAMGLCAETNIAAPDCIHIQMAIEIGADILVTSDSQVLRYADPWVRVANPRDVFRRLRELDFNVPDVAGG